MLTATLALVLGPTLPLQDAEAVRLLRDPWGVPHVLAESDRGAFFGHGWALAEDHLEPVLSALWTAQGRRTEIDGEDALPFDRSMRLLRLVADMERAWDEFPAEVRAAGEGFAAGINAYMAAHPDEAPAWAEPVEPAWTFGAGRMIQFIPLIRRSNGKLGGRERAARLSLLSTGTSAEHLRMYGSNAWAVAPSRVEERVGAMLTDPHLPWKNEFRLYEVHMRGATFELLGAGFIGTPIPVFGRTDRVSWAWTWNGPDHADVYRLRLDPEDPARYLLDGDSVPFEREEHVFALPGGDELRETLHWSVHGPVTWFDREAGTAIAHRLSVFGQTGAAEQMFGMARARDLGELDEALSTLQTPHFNLVAADADGSVQYSWNGRVPLRPAGHDFDEPVDGSTSATLWGADDVVPWGSLPHVVDPPIGFVQNCNNHPDHTTGTEADPGEETWLPGVVVQGQRDTMRAWYLRQRLAERERHSLAQLRALATDAYSIPHGAVMAQLRAAWERYGEDFEGRDAIAGDVARLLAWDGAPTLTSTAPLTFNLFLWEAFDHVVFLPTSILERGPEEVDEAYAAQLLGGLASARETLREMVPIPVVPWGLVHVIRKAGRTFPVASHMYPAISLWNANIDIEAPSLREITARVGSSYTAFTAFTEPPQTWSITPLGQTDDPKSPWCFTQTELYARGELKPVPFTDEQLEAVETTETVLSMPLP